MNPSYINHRPWSGLAVSVAIHAVILSSVIFTFPDSQYPVKPYLIFLGSFLNDQDISFSQEAGSGSQANSDAGSIQLDIRRDAYSHAANKPELKSIGPLSRKHQFKPVMAADVSLESRDKKAVDLEEEFGRVAPIRMKLVPDDNH